MGSATSVEDKRRSRVSRWLPLAVLAGGCAAFFALGFHRFLTFDALAAYRADLLAWVAERPVAAAFTYVLAYTIVAACSLPIAALVSVTGGFLFGTTLGALCAVIGATLGATILYLAARTAFHDVLQAKAGSAIKKMKEGFRQNAFNYLLFLRLVPGFPFFIVNLVPAFLGVSLRVFVSATFLGIIPGALVFASIGDGLGSVFDAGREPDLGILFEPQVLLPMLGLMVLALLPVAYKHWRRRS